MNLFWLFHKKIRLDRADVWAILVGDSYTKQLVVLHAMEDWVKDEKKFLSVNPKNMVYWQRVKEQSIVYENAVATYCTRLCNTHEHQRMGVDGVYSVWVPRKYKNVYYYARHIESLMKDLKKGIKINPA